MTDNSLRIVFTAMFEEGWDEDNILLALIYAMEFRLEQGAGFLKSRIQDLKGLSEKWKQQNEKVMDSFLEELKALAKGEKYGF